MRTEDVIKHFGSQAATARAIGLQRAAVNRWGEFVPLLSAIRVEQATNGALKHDRNFYLALAEKKLHARKAARGSHGKQPDFVKSAGT